MTDPVKPLLADPTTSSLSLSFLVDSPELLRIRILPAEFARLLGVSRQTVSQWIRKGHVSINPVDGRIDVQAGVRQVLRNTDPGRMRARVLRQAVADVQTLRDNLADAEDRAEVAEVSGQAARADADYFRRYAEEADCVAETLIGLLVQAETALRATHDSAAWAQQIKLLETKALEICDSEDASNVDDLLDLDAL